MLQVAAQRRPPLRAGCQPLGIDEMKIVFAKPDLPRDGAIVAGVNVSAHAMRATKADMLRKFLPALRRAALIQKLFESLHELGGDLFLEELPGRADGPAVGVHEGDAGTAVTQMGLERLGDLGIELTFQVIS